MFIFTLHWGNDPIWFIRFLHGWLNHQLDQDSAIFLTLRRRVCFMSHEKKKQGFLRPTDPTGNFGGNPKFQEKTAWTSRTQKKGLCIYLHLHPKLSRFSKLNIPLPLPNPPRQPWKSQNGFPPRWIIFFTNRVSFHWRGVDPKYPFTQVAYTLEVHQATHVF